MGKLDTIIFADCDGTVAGWTRGFTAAARLRRQLALLRQLDDHRKAGAARAAGRRGGRHRVQAQRRGLPEAQVASAPRLMPPIALVARRGRATGGVNLLAREGCAARPSRRVWNERHSADFLIL